MGRHSVIVAARPAFARNIASAIGRSVVLILLLRAAIASAQSPGSPPSDRARLADLLGDSTIATPAREYRLDALASRVVGRALAHVPITLVRPEIRLTWNSALPYSVNDGPLWAGRGVSFSINGGLSFSTRSASGAILRVVAAPTLTYSQNAPFQIIPGNTPGRSDYSNPFHGPDASLDLPHRFGDRHLLFVDPGRSGISVEWPDVVIVGATTENAWWGPGIRNGLIMSSNAPGIPRVFAGTASPIATRFGRLEAELFGGVLTKSRFFGAAANENRTLSGFRVQWRPPVDSSFALGFARVVYAPVGPEASPFAQTFARAFDAVSRWENLSGAGNQRSDQIAAVFARWRPVRGLEVYGEWARMDLPRNATELLTAAHQTGAWTLGMQWAHRRRAGAILRLQAEATYLEQSAVLRDRLTPDFYSGQGSPQGYTQRGQIIGASIGPGASSQWIAVDRFASRWQAGGFVGRIRWDNDAMYRQIGRTYWNHDVSVLAGIRGGWRAPQAELSAELTIAKRYNYLFQNGIGQPGGFRTVDVNNLTLAFIAGPR